MGPGALDGPAGEKALMISHFLALRLFRKFADFQRLEVCEANMELPKLRSTDWAGK